MDNRDEVKAREVHEAAKSADLKQAAEQLEASITLSGDRMLPYFRFAHLPPALQDVSGSFAVQATFIVSRVSSSAERTAGLRKLLEAKDCIVRAALEP